MPFAETTVIDFSRLWVWFLAFVRFSGVLSALPGIGTEQMPKTMRGILGIVLAFVVAITDPQAETPETAIEGTLMIGSEFLLGWILGTIPALVLSALTIAGQVTAGTIGLGQANLIDPSLGGSFSVLARVEALFGTIVFLAIDGHHTVLRAAASVSHDLGAGMYRPGMTTASIYLERFINAFELSVTISAPILVTVLVAQFVLGLITKFVPQVNIFIISLPLTIFLGLYIIAYTFPGMSAHLYQEFSKVEEISGAILEDGPSPSP